MAASYPENQVDASGRSLTLCSDSGGTCSDAEHRLFSVIFLNYNPYIRPVENVSDPVVVQFEVSMSQLVKVVSRLQKVTDVHRTRSDGRIPQAYTTLLPEQ